MATSSIPEATPATIGNIALSVITIIILYTLYLASVEIRHPLRKYPGPFLSKFSPVPLAFHCRMARHSQWVQEQHQNYGRIVRITPNHISISDPKAVSEIYGHKTGFLKGPFYEDESQVSLGMSKLYSLNPPFVQVKPVLFNSRDPHTHQRKRRYMSPAFSPSNMLEFEPYMTVDVLALATAFKKHLKDSPSKTIDFSRWSSFLAFDVIGDYAFGQPFGFLASGRDNYDLINTIEARGEVINAVGRLPIWLRPWMQYLRIDPFWYNGVRAKANLANLGRAAYGKRKAETSSRKDLLSFMLNAKDPDNGLPLPGDEVLAEAISFIVGGSDTTASTMTFVMDFMSRDSGLQEELYEELCGIFPSPLDEEWVASDELASKGTMLNAVIKETLRLRPTSSTGLERITPAGGRNIVGNFYPENTFVSVPTTAILHDPSIFEDPDKFLPKRWLGEDVSAMNEWFIPFSVGPRACIGRNFAWMEMNKTLATIFRLFEFERTTKKPSHIREGFFLKITECDVRMKRRQS